MTDFIIEGVLHAFWPSALAVLVVAGISVTMWGRRPRRMAAFSLALSVAVLAWYIVISLSAVAEPTNNILTRDIVGELFLGTAAPLLAAGAAVAVRNLVPRVWAAGVAAALVGTAWVLASPLLLLLVHCTSGDCL